MKKLLSLLTASALIFSISGAAYAAVPYETEDSSEDEDYEAASYSESADRPVSEMSMDEVLDIVGEAARKADAAEENCGGECAVELTDEEIEAIRIAVEHDKEESGGGLRADDAYYYSSANANHGYYYKQLKDDQKKIYDALGARCEEYLNSDQDSVDESGFFDILEVGISTDLSIVEVQQSYWTFFYSNPQYFFLPSAYSYGVSGDSAVIALRSHPECREASARHDMDDDIKSITAEWMTEVNKCTTDADKEMKMAQLIADNTIYRGERDSENRLYQTIMAVFVYKKSVCTGYAKSLVYLCDIAGIEAIVVTSKKSEAEAHAWTRVKLDGKWYEADPTWYDQTENGMGYWDVWMNKSTATITAGDDLHNINEDFALYYQIDLPECNEDYNGGTPGPLPDPTSGECGDDALWEYNKDNGVLTITGSGDMDDYASADDVPWAMYNGSITSVDIQGVSSVGDNAFSGFSGLREAKLPDGLAKIGDNAFSGCAGLTKLSLPASLSPDDIGTDAFAGCSGLSHIHIPHWSLPSDYFGAGGLPADADIYHVLSENGYCDDRNCPYGMFGYESGNGVCGDSLSWEYDKGVLTITGSGDMYDYDRDAPWSVYDDITKIILPDAMTYIGEYAFADMDGIHTLTLPSALVGIGEGAFDGCTGIEHIHIPYGMHDSDAVVGAGGLPTDDSIYHKLSEKGFCDDKNCPEGLFDYSRVTVSFGVKGVFGGREVTFSCDYPEAKIYFAASTSKLTLDHTNVTSGETVLFENFYGTIYAKTYINGTWGTACRLILKIPVVKDPEITVNGTTAVIKTATPDSYIIYTTDGTVPSTDNGKRVYGQATVDISSVASLKAIAVRSCFTNSGIAEKTFDFRAEPPAFAVKGVFGGRNVTFTSATPGAVIYYSKTTSAITTRDKSVKNGGTVLFEDFYGTIYAKAYINGKWSNVSRLILKIPRASRPTATAEKNVLTVTTTTPDAYIVYTTDGTMPSAENGTKLKAPTQIKMQRGMQLRVIAIRSGFSDSYELRITVQ